MSDEIADVLDAQRLPRARLHLQRPPDACAAGLANLDIIEREKLVERVRDDVGPYFQQKLQALAGHPAVGEVRGFGLIGALELLPRGGRAALDADDDARRQSGAALAREEGVIVRGIRDLIALAPPLIITRDEIDRVFDAVARARPALGLT